MKRRETEDPGEGGLGDAPCALTIADVIATQKRLAIVRRMAIGGKEAVMNFEIFGERGKEPLMPPSISTRKRGEVEGVKGRLKRAHRLCIAVAPARVSWYLDDLCVCVCV